MNTFIFALCIGALLTLAVLIIEFLVAKADDYIEQFINDIFKKDK